MAAIFGLFGITIVLLNWGFIYTTTTSANTTGNSTLYSGYAETVNSTPWAILGFSFIIMVGGIFYAVKARGD